MNKEQRNAVVEYATGLSEDELRWLGVRLTERLSGDLPEALEALSKSEKVDAVLASANSANDFYDLIDKIRDVLVKEAKKKGLVLKPNPTAA